MPQGEVHEVVVVIAGVEIRGDAYFKGTFATVDEEVPEPASALLVALALAGAAGARRIRRAAQA